MHALTRIPSSYVLCLLTDVWGACFVRPPDAHQLVGDTHLQTSPDVNSMRQLQCHSLRSPAALLSIQRSWHRAPALKARGTPSCDQVFPLLLCKAAGLRAWSSPSTSGFYRPWPAFRTERASSRRGGLHVLRASGSGPCHGSIQSCVLWSKRDKRAVVHLR